MTTNPLADIDARVDEDGFVCLVAPDSYSGFVNEDWTLDQILAHFVQQMNAHSLFAAAPGPDLADLELDLRDEVPPGPALRRATGIVQVGPAGLWLTDYTQLTMAAQFPDQPPISNYSSRQLPVSPGRYRVTLCEVAGPRLIMAIAPDSDPAEEHQSLPWFD